MFGKFFGIALCTVAFGCCLIANGEVVGGNAKLNVDIPSFTVIGIDTAAATVKERNQKTMAIWKKFEDEKILSKIPGKIDKDTLAIVHIYEAFDNYEASTKGAWSMMIGARVDSNAQPPPGMIKVQVPASKYAQITSRKGPVMEVTPETWATAWKMKELKRKYSFDYEVHPPGDPKSTIVQLFVSTQ